MTTALRRRLDALLRLAARPGTAGEAAAASAAIERIRARLRAAGEPLVLDEIEPARAASIVEQAQAGARQRQRGQHGIECASDRLSMSVIQMAHSDHAGAAQGQCRSHQANRQCAMRSCTVWDAGDRGRCRDVTSTTESQHNSAAEKPCNFTWVFNWLILGQISSQTIYVNCVSCGTH
jgi:hypothetical protein